MPALDGVAVLAVTMHPGAPVATAVSRTAVVLIGAVALAILSCSKPKPSGGGGAVTEDSCAEVLTGWATACNGQVSVYWHNLIHRQMDRPGPLDWGDRRGAVVATAR